MNLKKISALLAASAMGFSLTGCGLPPDDKPFDPRAMQSLYRDRAAENVTRPLAPLPKELDKTYLVKREGNDKTPPSSQPTTAQAVGPTIRMSLRDLIQLAAANSLDVKVAGYQPAIDQARVVEADARFDPSFFANFNIGTQWLLSPGTNNPSGTQSQFETGTFATGFTQNLANGAQIQLQYQAQRTFRFPGSSLGNNNPFFESDLTLQITQPLLQNFGTEVNRARIDVARNTQRVSLLDFRLQLEKTLGEIEDAYWQLVQAEQELKIQEKLYQDTVDTAVILQRRVGQDVTRVQLGQTNAALQGRKAALVDARKRLKTLSNAIKKRVNDPTMPVSSNIVILPDDRPVTSPIKFDLAEQVEAALKNRAELAQQQIRIDSASIVNKAAKNNLLPQLNLVGSIGLKGGNDRFGSALNNQLIDQSNREFAIGFQFEVPLGNREPRAIYRRTTLQRLQSIDQYRGLIEQVCQEVKDAHDDVYAAWDRMIANRQFLFAATDALSAIQQEQDVGNVPLTPEFVNRKLNAQEQLAQAQREDSRATTDYNAAIAALERAKGTILQYDNVLMVEEPLTDGATKVSAAPKNP